MTRTKARELVGKKIKNFEVLDCKRENRRTYLLVVCPLCKKKKWMRKDTLDNPEVKSCGCYNAKNNLFGIDDITGQIFGRLKVIKPTPERDENGSVIWECLCSCGNIAHVSTKDLRSGFVKSCGCLGRENSRKNGRNVGKIVKEKHCVEGTNVKNLTAKIPKNNTSGIKGVHWCEDRGRWVAQIGFKGRNYRLGSFTKKEDAAEARKIAEEKMFGGFLEWYYKEHPEKKNENTKNQL